MKNVSTINLLSLNDKQLIKVSQDNLLSLTLDEMKTIQNYFASIKRNPTDVELETIAQTWSEHCKHKTLCGLIEYKYYDEKSKKYKTKIIDNLLKKTIFNATVKLNKKWCLSVFKDNAGVIEFDKKNAIAFKVETHNHPSALEPYGGAGTGIGGVIRDILGVGLGAKPIFNTDVFCFGNLDTKREVLPKGVLHPKRVLKGVVSGVRDYGNRMGIPTINGAVLFDEGFIYNPLVYCGTAGIMPKNTVDKEVKVGDYIVAVGGKTGRDGIHGATFSSLGLDENTESSAVQIGNPITEKKVMDTLLIARDKGLYNALTDCGAGGFSSAIGELGEDSGVECYLEKAPLKYEGLAPWEIWVSEAQERMVLSVPKKNLKKIIKVFVDEDVDVSVLGRFTNTKRLVLYYKKDKVCDMDMDFLHNGLPRLKRQAQWTPVKKSEQNWKNINVNLVKTLHKALSHPNIASKDWIIRQYDHEVQGTSVIKPLQGVYDQGPGDSSVVKPLYDSNKGVAVSCGINPEYGKIDPYNMVASNIDEALRNIVCVGGDLNRTALLDNFCWGDPQKTEVLGSIVQAATACHDYSLKFSVPFISGKDSLNNDYINSKGKKMSIPGTMLISAISVMENIKNATTMYLKEEGNPIYLIGKTKNELGGSVFSLVTKKKDTRVPSVDHKESINNMSKVSSAIKKGFVRACHDLSDGGLITAISEMAFSGDKGVDLNLDKVKLDTGLKGNVIVALFSESNSRFLIEVDKKYKKQFETLTKSINCSMIGKVTSSKELKVYKNFKNILFKENIKKLYNSWNSIVL